MEVPEEFITKVIESTKSFPIFLLEYNIFDDENCRKIIENEDLQTVLTFLKFKLIKIHKNPKVRCSFDVEKLCHRIPENNLELLHDILFYSLIIQPSFDIANELFNKSCSLLSDINEKNILHHLEIIDVILELFMLLKISIKKDSLCEIIISLITKDENNIWKKVVVEIIPKYVAITKNYYLFYNIYQKIKFSSLEINTLLALEKYFIPVIYDDNIFNILILNEYWTSLQNNLCNLDPFVKKQSQYLLKKSIETIFHNENYKNFVPEVGIINNLITCQKAWKNFIILCEVSFEKQIHLIEPTLKLYNSLQPLHDSWKNTITKLFINHPHPAVVKLTIVNILKKEWHCEIPLLIQGLNNNILYENTSNNQFMALLIPFVHTLKQEEYLTFVTEISNQFLSPVPFFYLCKELATSNSIVDLKIVVDLINSAGKVPHLYIRKGILHFLFNYFIRIISDSKNIDLNYFIQVISLLCSNNYLLRGNCSWKKLVNILSINPDLYKSINIDEFCLWPKEYAVFIILLIDVKRLNKNWVTNYLHSICKINVNKLDYLKFIFDAINISKDKFYFSNTDLKVLLDELIIICNETTYYTLEFFDTIEFILDILINRIYPYEDRFLETYFFEKLENTNSLCYIILSNKLIQLDTIEEQLSNLSSKLKTIKSNYATYLENHESNLKQKLFQNYYYTKLNIIKLLIKINPNNDLCSILTKINKYYDKGSLDLIVKVLDTLYTIIQCHNMNSNTEFLNLLIRCQKDIFNLRANVLFRPAIDTFISIILHPKIYQYGVLKDYSYNFCLSMFDSSQVIVGIRNKILECIREENMNELILMEGLLFGPILRKDQRIEFETCNIISKHIAELKFDLNDPYELDRKVRSKSAAILLSMINRPRSNFSVKKFFVLLMEKYNESAGKRYFGDSQIHLIKLRILQSLHLIVSKLENDSLHCLYEWLFNCLVNESQQPSIKIFIQWLMMRICNILNNEKIVIYKLMSQIPELKGTSCTTIFPLFYHLIKEKKLKISVVFDCVEFLLPYTMGQQFSIRCSAQMTIQHIYKIYNNVPEFSNEYDLIFKTVSHVLNQTAADKLDNNILSYYNFSLSIETIFYNIPRLTNVTPVECLPVNYFENINRMELRSKDGLNNLQNKIPKTVSPVSENYNENVQKKIDTYSNNAHLESPGNLIVVGSLVEKTPNLGGLSRTCEVFGVKKYVLNNIQLIKNKEYQSLSMSSENWVDTMEIKAEDLLNYLFEMKKEGYKMVGAEQTADSKKLNNFKFEKNTVLLLGNEKEGVPPNLIHALDDCIEIPQFGQIRSLNVHVAGALFLWEYVKQHHIKK